MKRSPKQSRRAGLSLLEVLLAIALLAILANRAFTVFNTAIEATSEDTREAVLEDQAQVVLRRIGYAIMGSDRESLNPAAPAPFGTDDILYRVNLGIEDGEVVWSDQEMIGLEDDISALFWSVNPETEDERRVVWANLVSPFLQGELPNGMDDNGNGLIDEKGLSFTVDRNAITIRLSLERVDADGNATTKTVETTVTCRHLPKDEIDA